MSRPLSSESVFRAVAHPIRREVLEVLRSGEVPVKHLLVTLRGSKANLSQHLRVLRHCGLISFRRRGTTLLYRLNLAALDPATKWFKLMQRER